MSELSFFQRLLKEVNHPARFVAMVNTWMEDPATATFNVDMDVDQFLEQLMDEQREPRSQVDYDQLFDALKLWMVQASVEQRCAMMFNSHHMVGLSCIERNDDVEFLKSTPIERVFLPNRESPEISMGFVANMLTATSAFEHTLRYIFSSSVFARIVQGGRACQMGETMVRITPQCMDTLFWRVFIPIHEGRAGEHIAQIVINVILDNLHSVAVHELLDLLAAKRPGTALTADVFNDPRFINWSGRSACLTEYLAYHTTILPAELMAHFPPGFEVAACHCAYLIIQANTHDGHTPQNLHNLYDVLHTHEDPIATIRRTIEKLQILAPPSLTQFPNQNIEVMLNCLSANDIQQWRNNPWIKDHEFSIDQYPCFLKHTLLENIESATLESLYKKRAL